MDTVYLRCRRSGNLDRFELELAEQKYQSVILTISSTSNSE